MVYSARKECGRQLARQAPVDADIVSALPETATPAAIGFAEEVRTLSTFSLSPSFLTSDANELLFLIICLNKKIQFFMSS